jgi:DNA-binding CsgD family transcriptional regulator
MEELTGREQRILEFMGEGRTDNWIAQQFHLSEQGFAEIVGSIEQKTGLHTKFDLSNLGEI